MSRTATRMAVLFAATFPTLVTWLYFVALRDRASHIQQTAYAVGKLIQFGFPLVWVCLLSRRPRDGAEDAISVEAAAEVAIPPQMVGRPDSLNPQRPNYQVSLIVGAGFAVLVVIAMFAIYHWGLSTATSFADSRAAIQQKVSSFAIDRWWKYALLGCFYAVVHSLLEEYYFRWFVAGQLQQVVTPAKAILWSSVAFMAHHVVVLANYFGWASPWTAFFSLAVAIGGAFWAWLYHRYRTLAGPWLSHLLVDAGIFLIGGMIVDFP